MALSPEYIISGLVKRGVPLVAAKGFTGNFSVESRLDPTINEIAPLVKGSRGGFGLAQWTGPRRRQLEAFAGSKGRDVGDPELQMDFLAWELANTEKSAANAIYSAKTPQDAAIAVSEKFLRPGIPHLDARIRATEALDGLTGGGGDAAIAGGSAEDDLSDVYGFLGVTPPAAQAAPEQPAPPPSPVNAYASTGALAPAPVDDLADVYQFLGVAPQAPAAPVDEAASMRRQAEAVALGLAGPNDRPAPAQPEGNALMRGLGLGGRAVVEGLAGIPDMIVAPAAGLAEALTGRNVQTTQQAVSGAMTSAGVPAPQTPAERIASAVQSGAASGLGGAGLARGAANVLTGGAREVARAMATGPGAQMLGGAGAGAGAQTAAEMDAGPIVQIGAGLAGAMIGGGAANIRRPTVAATADDVAAAERIGIKPMTSDVMPPQTFIGKNAQRIGEMVPFAGTGGMRAAQETARKQAVLDIVTQYGAAPGVSDDVMRSLSAQRSAELTKYATLKGDVISTVKGQVPVTNAVAAIDQEIAKLRGLKTAEVLPVVTKLEDWKRALQGQDLENVEALRKQIGEAFAAPELASVRTTGQKALSSIYGALRQDMGDFIKANGDRRDFTKWSVANKRLSELTGELEVTALRSALKKGDATPETVKNLLFSAKPSDVKLLFRNLPKEGKAKARAAIIQDMFERSSDGDAVSPQKFATQMAKRGSQIGVFFEGPDLAAVTGLKRALDLTAQASKSAVSTPTGVQGVPIVGAAVLTDLVGSAGAALTSGAVMGLGARAAESTAARNLLIALSKTKPGSPEEMKLAKRALEAVRAANQTETPE